MRDLIVKYAGVRPISDDKLTQAIAEEMLGLTDAQLEPYFAGTNYAGAVFLYESPNHKGKVLELVMGQLTDDHISALYEPSPFMNTRQSWIDARTELIRAVEKLFSAPEGQCAIMDHARGRHVMLSEFATAQLIDLITDSERRVALIH